MVTNIRLHYEKKVLCFFFFSELVTNLADGGNKCLATNSFWWDNRSVLSLTPSWQSCFSALNVTPIISYYIGMGKNIPDWNCIKDVRENFYSFLNLFKKIYQMDGTVFTGKETEAHMFIKFLKCCLLNQSQGKKPTFSRQWKYPKYQKCHKARGLLEGRKQTLLAEIESHITARLSPFFSLAFFPTHFLPVCQNKDNADLADLHTIKLVQACTPDLTGKTGNWPKPALHSITGSTSN